MEQYIETFLAAMTPIGELRLAIPLALTKFNLTVLEAYFVAVLGNLIPVIVLLLFLEPISEFLIKNSKHFKRFFKWLFNRTRNRIQGHYEVYGYIALVIFVAIPFPVTGAWTGSAAAYLLGIPFWRALGLITTGVLVSGFIVTLASIGAIKIF
ncbi:ligand-binding protein SH3 [bacterium]|nr:ligand-binding protein SH3 [bacterium]MDP6756276.1 small multi-drug export protein [Patescibacteria group bacterium]|tara:strand:+ start:1208 stop:1666 length:459 start_codon:yes stop_codon:yes gene_type:complete